MMWSFTANNMYGSTHSTQQSGPHCTYFPIYRCAVIFLTVLPVLYYLLRYFSYISQNLTDIITALFFENIDVSCLGGA
jgi:hypothetical protein